jgi:predicted 3-demethylubiquinone-9 3-methyltransferase (glyoxalase superfamily)
VRLLKDRFGASGQTVQSILDDLVSDPDAEKSERAMAARLKMRSSTSKERTLLFPADADGRILVR